MIEATWEQVQEQIDHYEIKISPMVVQEAKEDPYGFMLPQDRYIIGKNSDARTWEYLDNMISFREALAPFAIVYMVPGAAIFGFIGTLINLVAWKVRKWR